MKLETVPQNIVPLLKALTLSFTSYAERKGITLKFNPSTARIIAFIDKDKVEKIMTNVLSNAFKFTPEGGHIEVIVETKRHDRREDESGFVLITIHDTGIGIASSEIPKIFDRFYQVDGSRTREQEGTGIGLALTKELVELHRGTIEIESEEGKGTTCRISLPLGKEHLKPEEICEQDKPLEESLLPPQAMLHPDETKAEHSDLDAITETEKPLLLIVEDNYDVRNYIKKSLGEGYRIIEAVDGEDGWNKSIEQLPEMIVTDVMMPKIDGFELCARLKSDERTSHIPVILLTAKATGQDKIAGYETGADDYIVKPFEPEELRARTRNLIEQRRRIQDHFKKHGLFELDEKKITSVDKIFLRKVFGSINKHLAEDTLSVDTLVEECALSRSVLHRKIVSLIGEPPGELIRKSRLKKAAYLIEQKFGNISEIALEVGFSNPAYFSEAFRKEYGISPSQYSSQSGKSS
jgi:DNA-binding response OmpR family regulator